MKNYPINLIAEHPAIIILVAVVLIAVLYFFSKQLRPEEMKRFSLFMGIGIAFFITMFVLAMLIPNVVRFYPFVILGIALVICGYLFNKFKN
jgi:hypothetical protein